MEMEYIAKNDKLQGRGEAGRLTSARAPMLRQRDDTSDAIGGGGLAPEDEGPAGSRDGGWRGASKWGWQGMAESRLTPLVVLGPVPYS